MRRRDFLIGTAAMAGLAHSRQAWAQGAKLDRVAILSANFDGIMKRGIMATPLEASRTLDLLDFAQMIADRYNVRRVELQHAHFLSTEPDYLKTLRDRVAKAKSQISQITVDFGGNSISTGPAVSGRLQAIDLTKVWIDHAAALGCPRVLINHGALAAATRPTTIDALKAVGDYGRARKVTVALENRDTGAIPVPPSAPPPPAAAPGRGTAGAAGAGAPARGGGGGGGRGGAPVLPATWQTVVEVAKAGGASVNADTNNFPSESERDAGLRAMLALPAASCHAHTGTYPLAAAIKIAREVGYKGLFTIETTPAAGADPHAATKAALDELLKLI